MSTLSWSVEHSPRDADVQLIANEVVSHGRAQAGVGEPRPLACLVREDGILVASVTGRIEFARLFIHHLWVVEHRRRQGLGIELLARIERAAHELACKDVLVETLSDGTAAMYRRVGYMPLAEIANYIPGFTRHVLLKNLVSCLL